MNSNDHGTELQDLSHRDDRPLLDAFRENIFTKSRLEVPTMSTSNEIFSGPDQVHALFYRQSLRWLGTIVYAVFLFITLRIFQIKGNSDPAQEILFNFLKIALSLLMASNLNECFKESARILRWKLRAWAEKGPEMDMIMEIESIQTILYLDLNILIRRPKKFSRKMSMVLFSIVWILLFIAAQSSVALLQLGYSTQDGVNWNNIYTQNSTVNATNLVYYFSHHRQGFACTAGLAPRQATASISGERGLSYSYSAAYIDIPEVWNFRKFYTHHWRRPPSSQESALRFYEYNLVDDQQGTCPFFPNRTVTAYSGKCNVFPNVTPLPRHDVGGDVSATKYTFTNDSFTDSISIPKTDDGLNGTASLAIQWPATICLLFFIVGLHAVVAFGAVCTVKDIVVGNT